MRPETLAHRFSAERFFYLLRNRLLDELPVIAVTIGTVAAINGLSLAFGHEALFNQEHGPQWWAVILFAGGILSAAQAFKGMHDGKAGTDWLLLPATPFEKFSSSALYYLGLFPVIGAVLLMGLSALLALVERALGGQGGNIWLPFQASALEAWLQYLVLASVFLAGSASFRKAALIKTLAVSTAYGLAMALLLFAAIWLVYKGHGFEASHFSFDNGEFSLGGADIPAAVETAVKWTYRIAWNALLPLFALAYGFFRVSEKEARDEVQ